MYCIVTHNKHESIAHSAAEYNDKSLISRRYLVLRTTPARLLNLAIRFNLIARWQAARSRQHRWHRWISHHSAAHCSRPVMVIPRMLRWTA